MHTEGLSEVQVRQCWVNCSEAVQPLILASPWPLCGEQEIEGAVTHGDEVARQQGDSHV